MAEDFAGCGITMSEEEEKDEVAAREWVDENMEERLRFWGDDFVRLDSYLQGCFDLAFKDFCEKYPWLLQFTNLYGYLFKLGVAHVQFYLGHKRDEELNLAVKYEKEGVHFDYDAFKKIIEKRGLKFEEAETEEKLAYKKADVFHHCSLEIKELKDNLLQEGKKSKVFWMKRNLQKFFRAINEWVGGYIEDDAPSFSFPKEFIEKYRGKTYEGEEGKKKITKAIFREVFAEFEKDLRSVQRDVLGHWWEREDVKFLAKVVALLSVFASLITIGEWLIRFEWVKSLLG